jgi:hypothetical protein
MLLAVKDGHEIRYRELSLSSGSELAPVRRVTSAHLDSGLRAVPMASPLPAMMIAVDEHVHAFVDTSQRVNVVFARSPCM